jgi:thioredoxin family protein
MRIKFIALLFVLTVFATSFAQSPSISWSDSTRDVYIDGQIDRGAQVLFADSPRRIAVLSPRLDLAVILDLTEHTVSTTLKELFTFSPDKASATSDAGAPLQKVGAYTLVDASTYLFAVDGKPIMFRSHPGMTGEMDEKKLWETVPVWRSQMENYQPKSEAVAALKTNNTDTSLTIALGTWCPDSKNYVPKLLKALSAAGNKQIKVKILGIDRQFHDPMETIQQRRLINVPTVIVERGGREIGRIVETPASDTMEEDLVAILAGKPKAHNGRWDRGPRLASGTYIYKDQSGKERGKEQWEMYRTEDPGRLLHSLITAGDVTTEIWHRVDKTWRPTFVEITQHRGDSLSRVRYNLSERSLTARLRGNHIGAIEQTLDVPARVTFFSSAIAAGGWEWLKASEGPQSGAILSYVAPAEFDKTVGALGNVSFTAAGEEKVRVPAGEFQARRVVRKSASGSAEWWLHPELSVPVRGQVGGLEFVLTSLEVSAAK